MFGLCDAALYVAILSELGPVAQAVTTSATINFLRKPAPADLIAKARLVKLGRRLAVGEVAVHSDRRRRDGGALDRDLLTPLAWRSRWILAVS